MVVVRCARYRRSPAPFCARLRVICPKFPVCCSLMRGPCMPQRRLKRLAECERRRTTSCRRTKHGCCGRSPYTAIVCLIQASRQTPARSRFTLFDASCCIDAWLSAQAVGNSNDRGQILKLRVTQSECRGADVFLQMSDRRSSRNGQHDRRAPEQPCQRHDSC